jgi:hypothetical protein
MGVSRGGYWMSADGVMQCVASGVILGCPYVRLAVVRRSAISANLSYDAAISSIVCFIATSLGLSASARASCARCRQWLGSSVILVPSMNRQRHNARRVPVQALRRNTHDDDFLRASAELAKRS